MAENILQQHMKGNTQATIESKLNPKELAFNETLLQAVYKHLNGVTIETLPFASKLAQTTPGNSGGAGIGIDSSANSILASTNSQALFAEIDAYLAAQSLAGLMDLTTAQTVTTGLKTFAVGISSKSIKIDPALVIAEGFIDEPTAIANPIDITGYSRIILTPGLMLEHYFFENLEDGVALWVQNRGSGEGAIVHTNGGPLKIIPAFELRTAMYDSFVDVLNWG